jgi:hypothetical protein
VGGGHSVDCEQAAPSGLVASHTSLALHRESA